MKSDRYKKYVYKSTSLRTHGGPRMHKKMLKSKPESILWSYINQQKTGFKIIQAPSYAGLPENVQFASYELRFIIEIQDAFEGEPALPFIPVQKKNKLMDKGWTILTIPKEAIEENAKEVVRDTIIPLLLKLSQEKGIKQLIFDPDSKSPEGYNKERFQ